MWRHVVIPLPLHPSQKILYWIHNSSIFLWTQVPISHFRIYRVWTVAEAYINRDSTWLIWRNHSPSLPNNIVCSYKPWRLNGIDLLYHNKFLFSLIDCSLWLVVPINSHIAPLSSSIPYCVNTSILFRTTHFRFRFFCILCYSLLLGHHQLWMNNFCRSFVIKWCKWFNIHFYRIPEIHKMNVTGYKQKNAST